MNIARRRHAPTVRPRRERGIALILVLWLTMLLTVIATGFAFSMRSEAMSARNSLSLAQARAAADGAIERMAFELSRPRFPAAWSANGQPHDWRDGEVTIVATAVDESAKIDLNAAPDLLLKGLFGEVGGATPDATARIVDAIADWRDQDDLKRPNGAEEADYRLAGMKQKPANGAFETVSELARVMGMTPAIYARIAASLTVHSRQPGINSATASRDVLLALPGATAAAVDDFVARRGEALAEKRPAPPFPPAAAFPAGAVPVWRIRAQATTADGVTFVRDAVVKPSGEARRPLISLSWQEGDVAASATDPAGTAGNDQVQKSADGRP